jgi:cytochrome b subunit of formate dehydrogenase
MTKAVTATPQKETAPKVLKRYIYRREAIEAAKRFHTLPDGKLYVVRFTRGQQIEHYILLLSFTLLGITGLAQTYSTTAVGNFILTLLGGIDSTRQVHHMAAFIFGSLAIYHVALFFYNFLMGRRIPKMIPEWGDVTQAIKMLKLNLSLTHQHPQFDRYTFEEKAEYWALVWGTVVMGITGLMQLFPIATTYYLPGWAIPVGRALHKWEAILAVLAILTWHMYHSVIKKLNTSIFTGLMSIEDMQEEHPLELAYLESAAASVTSLTWPVLIEIPLEEESREPVAAKEVQASPPPKAEAVETTPQTTAEAVDTTSDDVSNSESTGDPK